MKINDIYIEVVIKMTSTQLNRLKYKIDMIKKRKYKILEKQKYIKTYNLVKLCRIKIILEYMHRIKKAKLEG